MSITRLRRLALLLIIALLAGSILACEIGGAPAKPTITITAPTSDAQFEEGEEVNVLSSANDAKGITRVELYVDGELYRTDTSPSPDGEKSLAMVQTWTATDPGPHTLRVIAYNVDGTESDPWAVTIEVVEVGGVVTPPSPTTAAGPPPAATATTPPPPPEATATTPPPPEPTATEAPPTNTPEPELPDLVLLQLYVNPPNPAAGDSVEVSIDVANDGYAPSGSYTVVWRYGSAGPDYCEWNQGPLPPASGGTLHCTVEMYESYTTVAEVDWEGNVDESDEDNNRLTLHVDVVTAPLADLYISEFRAVPASPQQGSPAMVGCRIHNGGTVDAVGFKLIWRSAGPTIGCEWDGLTLAAGASRWEQCEYTYSGWNPNYTTTCVIDVDGEVDEIQEDNNELVHMLNVRPD
jgi:subtilase family serine protease